MPQRVTNQNLKKTLILKAMKTSLKTLTMKALDRRVKGEERPYIPTDLFAEILCWLPSDYLKNLKLVCKEWNLLISSSEFIEKHVERSEARCSNPRILVLCEFETLIFDFYKSEIIRNRISLGYQVSFLGSCDGLVLYYERYVTHVIGALNPSTGKHEVRKPSKSLRADIDGGRLICTWFGRHPSTGEYVLVLAKLSELGQTKLIMFKVYSLSRSSLLSSSSILELDMDLTHTCFNREGTLLHGRLHCYGTSDDQTQSVILVYDFQTNRIERIQPPLHPCHGVGVVEGCLCAIGTSDVWMMKEYGDNESWTKYADIEERSVCCNMWTPVHLCANVGIVLNSRNLLMLSKKPLREMEYDVWIYGATESSIACLDSLVSPASVWKGKGSKSS